MDARGNAHWPNLGAPVPRVIPLAQPVLAGNEKKYVNEALDTGWLTHAGRFEAAFEKAAEKFLGRPCLATSSGTGALHVALLALGVGYKDEVIIPNLTFGATASVVLAVGAIPILVDVDPDTWGLSTAGLYKRCNKKTRAIIPVHLYGEDAGTYSQLGIPVIEDGCESFGVVPPRGRVTCYSLYGNKMITSGEGGIICGDFKNAESWRDGGFDSDYRHEVPGLNYRMTNLQAAVALAQIERARELIDARLKNVEQYRAELKGRGKWLFVVETPNPRALAAHLKDNGVDTRPVFTPLHRCPAFRQYASGNYKVSDDIWGKGLCLPTGPHMDAEAISYVITKIKEHDGNYHLRGTANSRIQLAAPG